MTRPIDIRTLQSRDAVEGDKRLTLDADNNLLNSKQLGKPLSEAEMKALPVRDAVLGDKRLSLDVNDEFLMTNQPDNSAIGTAATYLIPSDYITLQEAINDLSPTTSPEGDVLELQIELGHNPSSGILVENGDYSRFLITSQSPTLTVSASFPVSTFFIRGENARIPILGALVDMAGRGDGGYYARAGSEGTILPNCGIKNLGQGTTFGVETPGIMANASTMFASGAVSSGNPRSVWATRGAHIEIQEADLSGATGDLCAYASRNSSLHIINSNCTSSAGDGLILRRSRATADGADFSNAAGLGILVERTSQLSMTSRAGNPSPKVNNCGSDGIKVQEGSALHLEGGEITGNGRDGISVSETSLATSTDTVITGNSRYGINTRHASNQSAINCTITGNTTFNIFNGEGGFVSLENTTTEDGVVTENYLSGSYRNSIEVSPDLGLGYGRFIVSDGGAGLGAFEYDVNDDSIRLLAGGSRQARLSSAGVLRPETDSYGSIGAVDRRWGGGYIENLRLGQTSAIWTSGAGSPEGVISAVVGSVYTDSTGGAGTTLYIKEAGGLSTGWVSK